MNKKNDEITIKSLAEMFIPVWWLVLAVALACALVLGGASRFLTGDTYTSSAKYMVVKIPSTNTSTVVGLNSQEILAMQSMIANAKEIINTKDFCDAVLADIDNAAVVDLTAKYNAEKTKLEELINSKTSADDKAAIDKQLEELKATYDAKVIELSAKPEGYVPYSSYVTSKQIMNMISVTLSNSETTCYYLSVKSSDPELSRDIALVAGNILTEKFVGTGYAVKIDRLQTPLAPSAADSKNEVRNALVGFAAGAFITLLVVFVCNRFDIVIRSREKIEDNFDYPILAVIPRLESGANKS